MARDPIATHEAKIIRLEGALERKLASLTKARETVSKHADAAKTLRASIREAKAGLRAAKKAVPPKKVAKKATKKASKKAKTHGNKRG